LVTRLAFLVKACHLAMNALLVGQQAACQEGNG